jgi:hypothetical protein
MEGIHLLLGDQGFLLPPFGEGSWLTAKDNTCDSFGELRCVFSLEPRMLRSSGMAKVTRTTLLSGRASCHLCCSLWHFYLPDCRVRPLPLFGFLPPTPISLLADMLSLVEAFLAMAFLFLGSVIEAPLNVWCAIATSLILTF